MSVHIYPTMTLCTWSQEYLVAEPSNLRARDTNKGGNKKKLCSLGPGTDLKVRSEGMARNDFYR